MKKKPKCVSLGICLSFLLDRFQYCREEIINQKKILRKNLSIKDEVY